MGQVKEWDVPQTNIFKGITSFQIWNPKQELQKRKTKPIPDDIFDKILECAMKEEIITTKAGIIIQSQTGLISFLW